MTADNEDTRAEFDGVVNMTAKELRRWLDTDESKSVGQKPENGGESTGHRSGRRIVDILEKKDLTDDDYAHMRRVVGYAHRHLEQRPSGEIENSKWRYSLMNWGHDPLKS
ncbi:DUF3140 domain-containing protein [Nocardia beijingensis]|uniref:DUF3140 domain-containing protein n=1 Tax=Nocardia beijingensis TaxID=95162 RepID=UPI0018941DCF|nr:DUF3140 domain-containing protein [Nocardia beijingensis]MBF6467379.1 DUF3140 domain-containing protein [Nocardia beijingensis]